MYDTKLSTQVVSSFIICVIHNSQLGMIIVIRQSYGLTHISPFYIENIKIYGSLTELTTHREDKMCVFQELSWFLITKQADKESILLLELLAKGCPHIDVINQWHFGAYDLHKLEKCMMIFNILWNVISTLLLWQQTEGKKSYQFFWMETVPTPTNATVKCSPLPNCSCLEWKDLVSTTQIEMAFT